MFLWLAQQIAICLVVGIAAMILLVTCLHFKWQRKLKFYREQGCYIMPGADNFFFGNAPLFDEYEK